MDEPTPEPPRSPADRPVTQIDRQSAVDRIQAALANDRIQFSEVDDRFGLVFSANSHQELSLATAGLPPEVEPPPPANSRHLAPENSFSLIGDVKVGGWLAVGPTLKASSLIGDVVVDISSASIPAEGMELVLGSGIGDIKVIVPDGARVQSSVTNLIGDRKEILAPPMPDGPVIRIKAFGLIGDTAVYSLSAVPEGKLQRLWATLRRAVDR